MEGSGENWEQEREGGGEGVPAIRAPIGSILLLLVAAKFRLVNQTGGGVGCHSMPTGTSYHFSRFEHRRHSQIPLKTEQELPVRALLNRKDVLLPTGYGKSLIYQMFVCAKDFQMNGKATIACYFSIG